MSSILTQGKLALQDPSCQEWRDWIKHCFKTLPLQQLQAVMVFVIDLQKQGVETYEQLVESTLGSLIELGYQNNSFLLVHHFLSLLLFDPEIQSIYKTSPEEIGAALDRYAQIMARDPQRKEQVIQLQNLIFEVDPNNHTNALKLLIAAVDAEDEFSAAVYLQAVVDTLPNIHFSSFFASETYYFRMALRKLFSTGYDEAFFSLGSSLAEGLPDPEQSCLYTLLYVLANHYLPDWIQALQIQWKPNFLFYQEFTKIAEGLLVNSERQGYSIIAEAITQNLTSTSQSYLSILGESEKNLLKAAELKKVQAIIEEIIEVYPLDKLKAIQINSDNYQEYRDLFFNIFYRVSLPWNYISDNRFLIRSYQMIAAQGLSTCINIEGSLQNLTWSSYPISLTFPLKIGYLSSTFHRHSVGFLSHQILAHHHPDQIQVYCYYYDGHPKEQYLNDVISKSFTKSAYCFDRFEGKSTAEMVQKIRQDQLDILILMDISDRAYTMTALRLAPIQVAWLAADSPGLPEIDHFIVDPYVLPEDSQPDYSETLLRLPAYFAVDSFDTIPIDRNQFRASLYLSPDNLVLLTAASSAKRTQASIEAHLTILRNLPEAILIIKGVGDSLSVIQKYKTTAEAIGVSQRIRFMAQTDLQEEHRGVLGLVDLVLDTFPYTGATHTAEALYMGTPVLTLVGQHYYGRMSYSLLKNVGLEACITWSVEDFIQRGIELGRNRAQLRELRRLLQRSRRFSIIWDAREYARCMEKTFYQLVQGLPVTPDLFGDPSQTLTADEWNAKGLQTLISPQDYQQAWEEALSCWRRGLAVDPYHFCCWMNRIHALWVLGDHSRIQEEAKELLRLLTIQPETLSVSDHWHESLVWLPCALDHTPIAHSPLHVFVRWLAEKKGVVYRPEGNRFWSLATEIYPQDDLALLRNGCFALVQGRSEGILMIQKILNPGHLQAQLAFKMALSSLQGAQELTPLTLPYEGIHVALEPSLSSVVTFTLLIQGKWFESEIELCRQVLQPGMGVIDVGANVGVYTFLAAQCVTETGRVYAIEPTPECITCLETTLDLNSLPQVKVIRAAAGKEVGWVTLTSPGGSAFTEVVQADQAQDGSVPQITLDALWEEEGFPFIHLLKVDAEGAEPDVFRGARTLLQNMSPLIIFENLHSGVATGHTSARILADLGYRFYCYEPHFNRLKIVDPLTETSHHLNIIALKSGLVAEQFSQYGGIQIPAGHFD